VAVFRGGLLVVLTVEFEEDGQRGAGDAEFGGFLGDGEGESIVKAICESHEELARDADGIVAGILSRRAHGT
jgi:hypothetical protein